MERYALALALGAALVACGGDGALPTGHSPVAAEVEVIYEYELSSAESESPVRALDCAGLVRLYPSWWGFSQVTMVPADGNRWGLLFEDVPIGRQRVNVVAPEGCGPGTLTVNGVSVTDSDEGFVFSLHPDGSVSR